MDGKALARRRRNGLAVAFAGLILMLAGLTATGAMSGMRRPLTLGLEAVLIATALVSVLRRQSPGPAARTSRTLAIGFASGVALLFLSDLAQPSTVSAVLLVTAVITLTITFGLVLVAWRRAKVDVR